MKTCLESGKGPSYEKVFYPCCKICSDIVDGVDGGLASYSRCLLTLIQPANLYSACPDINSMMSLSYALKGPTRY